MRDTKRDISSPIVGQDIDPSDMPDAPRQMPIEIAELAEHELHATVMLIVRRAEQGVVVLLSLRADFRIVDLEYAATANVAAGE